MANTFSSLFGKPQGKRGAMMIVIGVTAALLVVSLLVLGILGIVSAVRNKNVEEEPTAPTTNGVPAGFVTTTFEEGQLYRGLLIAVNDTYGYNADANANVEMITIQNGRAKIDNSSLYSSNATQTLVQKEALDALNTMLIAFYEATGDDNLWVNIGTNGAATGIYAGGNTFELRYTTGVEGAAKPAITESDTYDWIFTNAYKYGFVQMFEAPTAESGESDTEAVSQEHIFRYVGTVHAKAMQDKKIKTFDAYLSYLRDNTSATKNLSVNAVDKKTYKVYYIAGDAQQVIPEKYKDSCVISGDNMSGYIVTYCTTTTK